MELKKYINEIQDFPKKGISFKDISPILENPKILDQLIDEIITKVDFTKVDKIIGFDARGFLFGPLLSIKTNKPFYMLRKAGKLPGDCNSIEYDLEYGTNILEIQKTAINKGDRVLLIDDLLATGGTAKAGADLVQEIGGIVDTFVTIIELEFLQGRNLLKNIKIVSIAKY